MSNDDDAPAVDLASDISEFDYELPASAIAQAPLPERDASRLLVLDRTTGETRDRIFRDLPDLLDRGDLLVMNRSRVFPARLLGRRPGGGKAEILLVRHHGAGAWDALVRPGRRLKAGTRIDLGPGYAAEIEGPVANDPARPAPLRRVRLMAEGADPDTVPERLGHVPLPPYVARADTPADRDRYQTVYAREPGSVAAPTAGLHFTVGLLDRLCEKGIERAEVLLHVGPGTFQPVKAPRIEEHVLPAEPFALPDEAATAIAAARARGSRVVAIGTTTTRVLESRATAERQVRPGVGETALVIRPGHRFSVVDALVTNFHLPRSSLLLLVSAFAGRPEILKAYAQAIAKGYRFYSYGDAMLIL